MPANASRFITQEHIEEARQRQWLEANARIILPPFQAPPAPDPQDQPQQHVSGSSQDSSGSSVESDPWRFLRDESDEANDSSSQHSNAIENASPPQETDIQV